MKKFLSKILKFFGKIFKILYKILDLILITPISKIVMSIINALSNKSGNFDKFLNDIDLVVIMVGHNEIKENIDKLANKVVFDTRKVCNIDGVINL